MVESNKQIERTNSQLTGLSNEVQSLIDAGVRGTEIQSLVSSIVADSQKNTSPDELPMYEGQLPAGLITIKVAAEKFDIKHGTLKMWVARGHVQKRALLKGSARGGGMVVIAEEEIEAFLNSPRSKGGRPRKS